MSILVYTFISLLLEILKGQIFWLILIIKSVKHLVISGTLLSTSCALIYSIHMWILWSRYYFYTHFTEKQLGTQSQVILTGRHRVQSSCSAISCECQGKSEPHRPTLHVPFASKSFYSPAFLKASICITINGNKWAKKWVWLRWEELTFVNQFKVFLNFVFPLCCWDSLYPSWRDD